MININVLCYLFGHKMKFDGGRVCPKGNIDCSQPVFKCSRNGCDTYRYQNCLKTCEA